jgi:hypothetical protein
MTPMRPILKLVGSALYAAALLFVVAAMAAALAGLRPWDQALGRAWWREPAVWCLGVVVATKLVRASRALNWAARGVLGAARRVWSLIQPRRGVLGRWYHLSFHEPLTDSDQAHDALAQFCGYRLHPGDYRITSIRPSLRRGRLGAWVTVAQASKSTRRWTCCHVRWIDDPHELWLLRSALRVKPTEPAATPAPAPRPKPTTLERLSEAEIDHLLHEPSEA